jgi:hypothetical protein
MQYIVAGVFFLICVGVIIFGLKVLKESRKMAPKKPTGSDDEDEELPHLRT